MVHDPDGHVADASASPASVTPEQRLAYTSGAVGGMFQHPHMDTANSPVRGCAWHPAPPHEASDHRDR
jgi:hypothetical protein